MLEGWNIRSVQNIVKEARRVQQSYKPPVFKAESFHCPLCGVYAWHTWSNLRITSPTTGVRWDSNSGSACCQHCDNVSVWYDGRMIYPSGGAAPLPNPDLPDDIKRDYEEARSIVTLSPRGAAALLRLCVQKLCKKLGEPGENINTDIGSLVKKGLPVPVQQALDVVRVTGNEAVHPGTLDLRDDQTTALRLFAAVNFIADSLISQPKQIAEAFSNLSQSKLDGINQRDGKG